jgi:hypothetical protein
MHALCAHFIHEFTAIHAQETGIVFHLRGGCQLPTGSHPGSHETFEHEGVKAGTGGVNGGSMPSGTGTYDNDLFHFKLLFTSRL